MIHTLRLKRLYIWQWLLLVLGTTWFWAPLLNPLLSDRTALISQYEVPGQPYAWLFRIGDILAGCLIIAAVYHIQKRRKLPALVTYGLIIIGLGILGDPLFTTTCRISGNNCVEYVSVAFVLHAIETVVTSLLVFVVSTYDALKERRLTSTFYVSFQVLYGFLFVTQLASTNHINTLMQYLYQASIIVWLTWYIGQLAADGQPLTTRPRSGQIIRRLVAVWAGANGLLAIINNLEPIRPYKFVHSLYFAGDTAWLAQHGVIVGVTLLYVSRHLWRGEKRARQLFLFISAMEALKFAIIFPHAWLLALYILTFSGLFVLKPLFDRGASYFSWQDRWRDIYVVLVGVALAITGSAFVLTRTRSHSRIVEMLLHHFTDFIFKVHTETAEPLQSALLAHTLLALIIATLWFILWSLFRPTHIETTGDDFNTQRIRQLLQNHANSSEDFFKLWPPDKQYFWASDQTGFIAYRVAGSIAYALADPIAPTVIQQKLLTNFITFCRSKGLRACFLPIPESSLSLYKTAELDTIKVGASAVVDVQHFVTQTLNNKWWRWQRNRGKKLGYSYAQLTPPHTATVMQELKSVSDAWLQHDNRQERGFALGYFDETYLQACTLHTVRDQDGQLLAFANELPIFHSLKQATVDLMRFVPDADGVMPYLFMSLIQQLEQQQRFKYFDLGFVPLASMKGAVARLARTLGGQRFSASGLEQFKNKFEPAWQPQYLAYDGDIADLALIAVNLEKAMQPQATLTGQ
ncbi:MAG: hypothetical protein JWS12_548 [Candidatus Saccharibacteria bacterium]|nr:hypothetical protein [Candidatus Saccharibacteria bacterium]